MQNIACEYNPKLKSLMAQYIVQIDHMIKHSLFPLAFSHRPYLPDKLAMLSRVSPAQLISITPTPNLIPPLSCPIQLI